MRYGVLAMLAGCAFSPGSGSSVQTQVIVDDSSADLGGRDARRPAGRQPRRARARRVHHGRIPRARVLDHPRRCHHRVVGSHADRARRAARRALRRAADVAVVDAARRTTSGSRPRRRSRSSTTARSTSTARPRSRSRPTISASCRSISARSRRPCARSQLDPDADAADRAAAARLVSDPVRDESADRPASVDLPDRDRRHDRGCRAGQVPRARRPGAGRDRRAPRRSGVRRRPRRRLARAHARRPRLPEPGAELRLRDDLEHRLLRCATPVSCGSTPRRGTRSRSTSAPTPPTTRG